MANKLLVEGMELRVFRVDAKTRVILTDNDGSYYDVLLSDVEQANQTRLQDEAVASLATPGVSTGKTYLEVHIDDTIQLRGLSDKAKALLEKAGSWWKIKQAHSGGTTNRPNAQWFLASLPRAKQGLAKLHNQFSENVWIDKQDDPHFEIIRVCPCPKEFNIKDYS